MSDKVEQALEALDRVVGQGVLTGGYRVQAREILGDLFEAGRVHGAWEPAATPRSASEHLGRVRGPEEGAKVTESQEEPNEVSALRGWWEQTAHDEVAQLVAKMVEYGGLSRATDLTAIGESLVGVGVPEGPLLGSGKVQEGWLQELGIWFYLRGKLARWEAAIREGRPVSDDTLLDIGIYVRMAQRVRAVGGWPV